MSDPQERLRENAMTTKCMDGGNRSILESRYLARKRSQKLRCRYVSIDR